MADFDNHKGVIGLLRAAQAVESDLREKVREVHTFLDDPDGQWDDNATASFSDRPRYTLDKCNDLVDDIAGPLEQKDFDIQILPAGGDATKELAKTFNGMIRNIQNLSEAVNIYEAASRSNIRAGFDCWRVNQRWGDNNTFDQDLYIDEISDAVNRVWFDPNSVKQTREDAEYAFVLQSMSSQVYEESFPDGSKQSVGQEIVSSNSNSPEVIIVGEILYKKTVKREIVELSNGAVYVNDDKFKKIQDDLAKAGATIVRTRNREVDEVETRLFDGSGWLTDIQKTVFEFIPLVPIYANWSVRQNVPNYWGIVTKRMDAQRIYNYTESRKVEEGALAPLAKLMVTTEQIGPHGNAWKDLNTSTDPALPYVNVPDTSPPYKIGGAQINPGLESTSAAMQAFLQSTAGIDQLNGQPVGLQSGVAVELKQDRGDTRNIKYTRSLRMAICHTGKILVRSIPKVYDTKRQVRIINDDQTDEMIVLNDRIIDAQTGEQVEMIDLSKGIYDVVCNVSPSFKNRQSETVNAMTEMAAIDPKILETGRDVFYKSMNSPGFEVIAERERQNMVLAGMIPEDQLTDEEIQLLESQPEPQADPIALALQEEQENRADEIELRGIEAERKERELQFKIDKDVLDKQTAIMEAQTGELKELIEGLKALSEGGFSALAQQQSELVSESQENI